MSSPNPSKGTEAAPRPPSQARIAALALLTATAVAAAAPLTEQEIAQGYRDGVVIVGPRTGPAAAFAAPPQPDGTRTVRQFARLGGIRVVESETGEDTLTLAARLRATGSYDFVEPDYVRQASLTPNDPRFTNGSQWSLRNDGRAGGVAGADIGAEAGWNLQSSAANVIVAVIDTGLRLTHQDLAPNLWINPGEIPGNGIDDDGNGYVDDVHGIDAISGSGDPADANGHGSHVAGIIGAAGSNGIGLAGVAWQVRLMALRFLDTEGRGVTSDAIECIDYAIARGAHIINASYGAINSQTFSQAELSAVQRARDAGIIFVAAAGNEGLNLGTRALPPATLAVDNVVAVGASARRDEPWTLSNHASGLVELFAPGVEIVSADSTGDADYIVRTGTSMAAPHVSGALALLKARYPTDSYRGLINRLLRGSAGKSAVPNSLRFKSQTGGRLDLAAVLAATDRRPLNDDFADAIALDGANLKARGGNTFATRQAGEPLMAGESGGASLWWRWTAPANAEVTLDAGDSVAPDGTPLPAFLTVYTGSSLGTLTGVASSLPSTGMASSRFTFSAQAGTTYSIAVDTRNGTPGLIVFSLGSTPSNDAFARAESLSGASPLIAATNVGASRESGEPRILSRTGGRSLWYRWTAPTSGRFQAGVVSDEFDPMLAVYTGASLTQLSLVGANDDIREIDGVTDALVTFNAVAGTEYFLAVDSPLGLAGNFTLAIVDSLWQFATRDSVTSSPSVASDGTVYVGSVDRTFYALNPDGSQKWRYNVGGLIDVSAAAIGDDGTVYFGSNDGYLYALNPDGTRKWRYLATQGTQPVAIPNSVALGRNGDIYFKDALGRLHAITSAGTLRWRRELGDDTYAPPAIGADDTVYVGAGGPALHAFASDGTRRWQLNADGQIFTAPAIDAEGRLYFATLAGSLYAANPDGTLRWSKPLSSGITSSPVLGSDGVIYFGGYDRKAYAVNASDGSVRWTYALPDEVRASSPVVAADGSVLIGCYDGRLYHLEANGTLRRTYALGDFIRSSPIIAGTRLYVGSNNGKVFAIELGLAAAGTPWPMFQQNPRHLGRLAGTPPTVTPLPAVRTLAPGERLELEVAAAGEGLSYQWYRDGLALADANAARYTRNDFQPADAGLYTVTVRNAAGEKTSDPVIVAPVLPAGTRRAGAADQVGADIVHPNGNVYDQFLLTGPAATFTAAPGKVARLSFVDLSDDIVQVEFSGPGSLTVTLHTPTGPQPAAKYTQPDVAYMKGHARLLLTGAGADTHLRVFSVGTFTAVNQTLFPPGTVYDGVADLAFAAVASADGRFGGLRAGNTGFLATEGITGVYAPGVDFAGPVVVHEVYAASAASPMLLTGAIAGGDLSVAGGTLAQENGRAVQVRGLTRIVMTNGMDSHERLQPAQPSQARVERDGVDVTAQTVVNPAP